jgi:LysM repeat protein
MTYYVLQAAYVAGKACGEYTSPGSGSARPGDETGGSTGAVSQIIVPVKIATPDPDGKVFHKVEAGQSFWSIAVAYKITIKDLEIWNNISRENGLRIGQRLFIPGNNTEGYATPTPFGMVLVSTPDADGKIVHSVQAYQTLTIIAQAYKVDLNTILALNGILVEWPLQIDQKLLIDPGNVTPSPTPRPLTPIEKLTPASDGTYYHTVQSGETISWIASLYEISMADLMAWNGLNTASIIRPDQKLVLLVTPPATETPIPSPATSSPTATVAPPTKSPSSTSTPAVTSPTATGQASTEEEGFPFIWFVSIGLAAGLALVVYISRNNKHQ